MYSFYIVLLSAIFAAVSLSSCKESGGALVENHKPHSSVKIPKPGAAVSLASDSIVKINSNEITAIDVLLDVQEPGILHLEFSNTEGLELIDTKLQQSFQLPNVTKLKLPVKLRATNGRHYLNINTSIISGTSTSSRALAVILQSGDLRSEEEANRIQQKTSGEKIIVLPARESISHQ